MHPSAFLPLLSLQLTLYTYNWSPDLGANLNCSLTRLLQWQNARSHIVHCLLSQKLGLFHHHCFMDTPWHEDSKQVGSVLCWLCCCFCAGWRGMPRCSGVQLWPSPARLLLSALGGSHKWKGKQVLLLTALICA